MNVDLLPGVRTIETPLALKITPSRVHRRRGGQSKAYSRRINKKWLKRFGMKTEPHAYIANLQVIGGEGEVLFIHPELVRRCREALANEQDMARVRVMRGTALVDF